MSFTNRKNRIVSANSFQMRSKLTMPSNHGLESKHEILFRVKNPLMRSVLCECIATAFFMVFI